MYVSCKKFGRNSLKVNSYDLKTRSLGRCKHGTTEATDCQVIDTYDWFWLKALFNVLHPPDDLHVVGVFLGGGLRVRRALEALERVF